MIRVVHPRSASLRNCVPVLYIIFFRLSIRARWNPPFATKLLLGRLLKEHMDICVFTLDWSTQLKTLLKELNKIQEAKGLCPLKHSFGVWHL
jgi:hypothetical protein